MLFFSLLCGINVTFLGINVTFIPVFVYTMNICCINMQIWSGSGKSEGLFLAVSWSMLGDTPAFAWRYLGPCFAVPRPVPAYIPACRAITCMSSF